MLDKSHPITRIIITFFIGALILCTLSVFQKIIVGFNLFIPKSYIIPFFFGGLAGTIIGIYIFKVKDLNYQLAQRVNNLEKFLPICSYCKKIRSVDADPKQQDSWEQIEKYISHKTSTSFSHGVCPDCAKTHYSDYLKKPSNK